jgi:acyl-CoA synthetase (NDP forming)
MSSSTKIRQAKKIKTVSILDEVFDPNSLAMIGVPPTPGTVGYRMLKNIVDFHYEGEIYVVDIHGQEVLGFSPYSKVTEIQNKVDLAIVMVPASVSPHVIKDCVRKKVKGVVIISSGFSETGKKGKKLEQEIVKIIKGTETRIIGPNCLGIYCPSSRITFSKSFPEKSGRVACVSQSGGISSRFVSLISDKGLGISKLVSSGNECDLKLIDYLEHFAGDLQTRVISCYVEQIRNAREFLIHAKEISKIKPIIIWKAGRFDAGRRAVKSHTGAIAGSALLYSAAFKQTGVIEVDGLEELVDFTLTLACLKPRKVQNVGVITGSAGISIAVLDAFENVGISFPILSKETRKALKNILPWFASNSNPVDLTMGTSQMIETRVDRYKNALKILMKDKKLDLILVVAGEVTRNFALMIKELIRFSEKPLAVICFINLGTSKEGIKILGEASVPVYFSSRLAAKSIKALDSYAKYRKDRSQQDYFL